MDNDRKKLRFELLFERLFGNFHRILLTNLLFAVPSAVLFALFYFLNTAIFGGKVVVLVFLIAIIPLFPFYAGVVAVCRNIARGDKKVPVFSTFIDAVRLNFVHFLLHGLLVYIAVSLSIISISLYISMLGNGWFFYGLLFFSILIALFLLYMAFYIPLMNITYDLPLKYVYKNAFLMSFGEIKNNFFATIALAVFSGIVFTAIAICDSPISLTIVICLLWALLVPAVFTYLYVFYVYDGMVNIINSKEEKVVEINSKIDSKLSKNKEEKSAPKPQEEDFSDIDIASLKDTDDYIYHNGKMVKQSAILRMIKEREQEDKHE